MTALAPVLEGFFTGRLAALRASQHTVAAYRDTYQLLLRFAQQRTGKAPSQLDLADLDAELIGAFLDHLEADRGNKIATRNLRLAAIHSLFRYAALRCPEHAAVIARVLAIPNKRPDYPLVSFLTRAETDALLAAPDPQTPLGRRDRLLLTFAVQTGLRVAELTGVTCADLALGAGAHVRCTGKGRRERCTPLTKTLAKALGGWLNQRQAEPTDPLFPSLNGTRMSTDAVAKLLTKHVAVAAQTCPSMGRKHVTPHTLRHSCAMNLQQAGLDPVSIALWLGHASPRSTRPYQHADLALKEKALARAAPSATAGRRYKPTDRLLSFLEGL